jgi:leucyl aminopeptidase
MTVIGMMEYVAKFGSEYKITAYLPLAENSIGGDAYRPDDILPMKNGKTVRIVSTDAEGRLLLADSLALAQEENKDISKIYTVATLTGSAVVQFGDEGAGMVGYNDKMKKEVQKAGNKAGEDFLDAAFHKYMMNSVTSEGVADLTNTSNRRTMGCQTAGLFLTNFIKKKNKMKYLHLDIAGPAWVSSPFGVNPKNGTGFGTRTLINLIS